MKTTYLQFKSGEVHSTDNPELFTDAKRITRKQYEQLEKENACKSLRKMLRPGSTVFTTLKHVSRSGMYRRIAVFAAHKREVVNISHLVCKATGFKNCDGEIGVGGCGMDMGFHIVYSLGYCLWPNGTKKPHGTRNGALDKDGGYALKHRWL